MPQTTVNDDPAIAYEGQLSDQLPKHARSAVAEGAIVAGQPVLRGTDPDTQAIAIADSDTVDESTLLGWAVLETSRAFDASNPIAANDPVTVLRKGAIWVLTSAAVVAGNPVYVGNATAQLGDIDDATGTGLTLCPGARFLTSTSGAGMALIEVSLPAS